MGMFDYICCHYPLPVEGANALEYQTKDTPAQFCDNYEIHADGTLWYEDYDIEDQSKAGQWKREHPGKELPEQLQGIVGMLGAMTKTNCRWKQLHDFTGAIHFYAASPEHRLEWEALFIHGHLARICQHGDPQQATTVPIFEALHHTDPQVYRTLGIWPTLEEAITCFSTPQPPQGAGNNIKESSVEIHIHERHFGACGMGVAMAKLKWLQDSTENWQFQGVYYCNPAIVREMS